MGSHRSVSTPDRSRVESGTCFHGAEDTDVTPAGWTSVGHSSNMHHGMPSTAHLSPPNLLVRQQAVCRQYTCRVQIGWHGAQT